MLEPNQFATSTWNSPLWKRVGAWKRGDKLREPLGSPRFSLHARKHVSFSVASEWKAEQVATLKAYAIPSLGVQMKK